MKSPVVVLRRNWLQIVTYAAVFAAGLSVFFFAGYYKAEYDLGAVLGSEESVVDKILSQQDEITRLKKVKLQAEQDRKIEQQAAHLLREQFSTLQLEIDRLNRDLALYRSIVEPSHNDSGVYLKKLLVVPLQSLSSEQEDVYRYQIFLAQKSKQRSYTYGKIEFKFITSNSDERDAIIVEDEKGKVIKSKKYKFRYYQELEGKIKVAKNVTIKQVRLIVNHSKKKYQDIEYAIDWQDLKETSYVGK